jgi:hypothetical protein
MPRPGPDCAATVSRRVLSPGTSRRLSCPSLPWPTQTRPPALIDKQTAGHPSPSPLQKGHHILAPAFRPRYWTLANQGQHPTAVSSVM